MCISQRYAFSGWCFDIPLCVKIATHIYFAYANENEHKESLLLGKDTSGINNEKCPEMLWRVNIHSIVIGDFYHIGTAKCQDSEFTVIHGLSYR